MHFIFFTYAPPEHRLDDPHFCDTHPSGLGGAGTACTYVIDGLRKRGHKVELFTNDINQLKGRHCDVFISLRVPHVFQQNIKPGNLNYLWCQDNADEPIADVLRDADIAKQIYSMCDGIILLSHYQRQRWQEELHLPSEKVFMSSNGIPLEKFNSEVEKLRSRPRQAYYASAPYRGLHVLLLECWPLIHQTVPDAKLHVFSSNKVYQDEARDNDPTFQKLYEIARNTPGVVYHSSVSQKELREAAAQCRVLAYPCVFDETSCIAAMEAMASGCAVVSTARGALPETAWRNPLVSETPGWQTPWALEVAKFLVDDEYYEQQARRNIEASKLMDWGLVIDSWLVRFKQDLLHKG